jgi:hypothetical protein
VGLSTHVNTDEVVGGFADAATRVNSLTSRHSLDREIPRIKEAVMPNVSQETASESIALDGLEVHLENFEGGYTVCFESHTADVDLAPLFRGLPDDRCQFPRWGYVVEGLVEFRFADHTECYRAGDAYYVPPGHTPVHHAGARIVEFSPTDSLGAAIGVVMSNLQSGT